jgi:hypothetical protein
MTELNIKKEKVSQSLNVNQFYSFKARNPVSLRSNRANLGRE